MFAVPGWAVSAESLTQQSGPKPINSGTLKTQERAFADSKSSSKKRKRLEGEQTPSNKVSSEELERLWNKRFGDKSARTQSKKTKTGPNRLGDGATTGERRLPKSNEKTPANVNGSDPKPKESTQQDAESSVAAIPHKGGEFGSARKEKRPDKKKKKQGQDDEVVASHNTPSKLAPNASALLPPQPVPPQSSNLTPLQTKMRNKLTSARFRHLNQTLYTTSSTAALELFTNSPDLFAEYHAGFSQQVKDSWPQNPVDVYVQSIRARGIENDGPKALPRRKTGSCTIADLGCGDAPLARGCQSKVKALQLKFHNFDLHAPNTHVTKADISNLPLRDGEADIAVFCLSLMGTNWLNFVEEAWRILRGDGKGEVWVAEVKSRFGRVTKGRVVENSVGKKRKPQKATKEDEEEVLAEVDGAEQAAHETDISAFVDVFQRRGFELKPEMVDKGNKMFVSMVFVKSGIPTAGKHKGKKWNGKEYRIVHDGRMRYADNDEASAEEEAKVLKPCVYKTR